MGQTTKIKFSLVRAMVIFFTLISVITVVFIIFGKKLYVQAAPTQISTCANSSCTLTIPRYKLFMSQNDPNDLWVIFQNGRYNNFKKSNDGGLTWTATEPDALTVKQYMDYHASIDGDAGDNLYLVDPSSGNVYFRKIMSPGETASDISSPLLLTSAYLPSGVDTRSNVLAQDANNIWVFARTSVNATGNVRYFHSSDGGLTFPQEGWVSDTGYDNVRIGSLLIEGQPAVVVWYSDDSSVTGWGYKYFIWNGSQFVANADSSIIWGSKIYRREYGMSYVNGVFHVIYEDNAGHLLHSWKAYNNGTGSWQQATVETLAYNPGAWHPSLTRHGSDLYLFYIKQETSTSGNNNIYYRKWNQSTTSWGAAVALTSDGLAYQYPSGPAVVNPAADYIPVIWGTPSSTVQFTRVEVSPTSDTTPPAAVASLQVTAHTSSSVTLGWTAPGDDGSSGTAASYDLRYATATITGANWLQATQASGEPVPQAAGTAQSVTISSLQSSTTYYFSLKTYDEVPNTSDLSNVVSVTTDSGSPPSDSTPPAAVTDLQAN